MATESLLITTNKSIYVQSDTFQVTPGLIFTDGSLNVASLSDISFTILNGSNLINILDSVNLIFNMQLTGSVTILFKHTSLLTIDTIALLNIQIIPAFQFVSQQDAFYLINQELPSVIYTNDKYDSIGGIQPNYTDNQATAFVVGQLYQTMYEIFSQIYPNQSYTSNWEFALNGTNNLISNSPNATQIIALLAQMWTQTSLSVFNLELFLTTYIYLRTGISVTVYIDDNSVNFAEYWILGTSTLGNDTYLAPSVPGYVSVAITIFNNTLGTPFENELNALIERLMRADVITYTVNYTNISPTAPPYNLTYASYTYEFDPRLLYTKALTYIGGTAPFNLTGYY